MLPYTQSRPYHAQWGEDRWLVENLDPPTQGVFVDVGAGDGVHGSNTLYFENLGWRGLCIDADPRNHEPHRRRRSLVDTSAIASTAGSRPFGMYAHKPSWSGLQRQGSDYKPILVQCRPLEAVLQDWEVEQIDLLSIDVEGTELEVWDSFDRLRRDGCLDDPFAFGRGHGRDSSARLLHINEASGWCASHPISIRIHRLPPAAFSSPWSATLS